MLNFGKPSPKDHSEIAKRTKARLFDEERKKRIFNPATRTIGVSYYYNYYLNPYSEKFNSKAFFMIRSIKMRLIDKSKRKKNYKTKNKQKIKPTLKKYYKIARCH